MRILLIEDLEAPAIEIQRLLATQAADQVTWIKGVCEISDSRRHHLFEAIEGHSSNTISLDLDEFSLAFIDNELEGNFNGHELIRPLRRAGIVCVGISAKSELNGRMMEAGAHCCMPKHALADQLKYGHFDIDEVVSTFESANDRDIYTIKTSHRKQAHSWRY